MPSSSRKRKAPQEEEVEEKQPPLSKKQQLALAQAKAANWAVQQKEKPKRKSLAPAKKRSKVTTPSRKSTTPAKKSTTAKGRTPERKTTRPPPQEDDTVSSLEETDFVVANTSKITTKPKRSRKSIERELAQSKAKKWKDERYGHDNHDEDELSDDEPEEAVEAVMEPGRSPRERVVRAKRRKTTSSAKKKSAVIPPEQRQPPKVVMTSSPPGMPNNQVGSPNFYGMPAGMNPSYAPQEMAAVQQQLQMQYYRGVPFAQMPPTVATMPQQSPMAQQRIAMPGTAQVPPGFAFGHGSVGPRGAVGVSPRMAGAPWVGGGVGPVGVSQMDQLAPRQSPAAHPKTTTKRNKGAPKAINSPFVAPPPLGRQFVPTPAAASLQPPPQQREGIQFVQEPSQPQVTNRTQGSKSLLQAARRPDVAQQAQVQAKVILSPPQGATRDSRLHLNGVDDIAGSLKTPNGVNQVLEQEGLPVPVSPLGYPVQKEELDKRKSTGRRLLEFAIGGILLALLPFFFLGGEELNSAPSVAVPKQQQCFLPTIEDAFVEDHDVVVNKSCVEPAIRCPDYGVCSNGLLKSCEPPNHFQARGDRCVLTERANATVKNLEKRLAQKAINHVCDILSKESPTLALHDLEPEEKLLIPYSDDFVVNHKDGTVSLSDEYITNRLQVPTMCWCAMALWDTVKLLVLPIIWAARGIVTFLVKSAVRYPLPATAMVFVVYLITLVRRRQLHRAHIAQEVHEARIWVADKLSQDSDSIHAVSYLREEYCLGNAFRKKKVWPLVVRQVQRDPRIAKADAIVGGKGQETWQWVAATKPSVVG